MLCISPPRVQADIILCSCRAPNGTATENGRVGNSSSSDSLAAGASAPSSSGVPGPNSAVPCGMGCLNRLSYMHCDTRSCPCGEQCSNRAFHLLAGPRMEAFPTENRGYGVRALQYVSRGGFLIEYAGEFYACTICRGCGCCCLMEGIMVVLGDARHEMSTMPRLQTAIWYNLI